MQGKFLLLQAQSRNVSASVKLHTHTFLSGGSYKVGVLAVLGGEAEMPWNFDRVVKVEITEALTELGLSYDDNFDVILSITDVNGITLPEDTFSHHTIIHDDGDGKYLFWEKTICCLSFAHD